jgi:hypothetical protein
MRAAPVLRIEDVGVLAVEVVHPAVKAAQEVLAVAGDGMFAGRRVDKLAAAMGADVVERLDRVGSGADDDDGIVTDVVGEKVADIRDRLHAVGHLPHLGPQELLLRLEIFGRQEGLHGVGEGVFQIVDSDVGPLVHGDLPGFDRPQGYGISPGMPEEHGSACAILKGNRPFGPGWGRGQVLAWSRPKLAGSARAAARIGCAGR